jgi:hypothetical protein
MTRSGTSWTTGSRRCDIWRCGSSPVALAPQVHRRRPWSTRLVCVPRGAQTNKRRIRLPTSPSQATDFSPTRRALLHTCFGPANQEAHWRRRQRRTSSTTRGSCWSTRYGGGTSRRRSTWRSLSGHRAGTRADTLRGRRGSGRRSGRYALRRSEAALTAVLPCWVPIRLTEFRASIKL